MTLNDYHQDYPCTCHCGMPPCSNCETVPDLEAAAHGAELRRADGDELVDEGDWWQALPDGFVHDSEADVWHRAAHLPEYARGIIAQPLCGHIVEADTSCWFDECVVGCDLCPDCERVAQGRCA